MYKTTVHTYNSKDMDTINIKTNLKTYLESSIIYTIAILPYSLPRIDGI